MLATFKYYVVYTVFPIWPIVKLPNLFPKYLTECQNVKTVKSKFTSEKSNKNQYKRKAVLKENEKKYIN